MEEKRGPCVLAVRLRGTVGDSPDVEKTLESLMLQRTFQAQLLENNPSTGGMLRKVKALVAWGELDPGTLEALLKKRAEGETRNLVVDEDFVKRRLGKDGFANLAKSIVSGEVAIQELWRAGLKPRFRLHPP